jgi:UDP:flavonoid glycosyltransferase YjiC (YdhE family)
MSSGRHIAFMSVPLHGHVNPMLGVVAELVARGHRVTFATGTAFGPLVRRAGATPVGYPTTFPDAGSDWLPADDDGRHAVTAFTRERDAALPVLAAAYRRDRPDLVVADTVTPFAPPLVRAWRVPEVQFSPTHVFYEGSAGDLGETPRLEPAPRPCVVAMPRSLQIQPDRVDPRHVFVGHVAWRRDDGAWSPPRSGRVALVSLGTTYNGRHDVLRQCVEAFTADGGWHVVVAASGTAPDALGPARPDVEVLPWVPQQQVLAHAAVFVTAGGTGSVLEGLAAGVPLVVVPQGVEQHVTAARVAALGLGAVVRPVEADAAAVCAAVRAAVHTVTTDPGIRPRLDAMRAEIAASGGASAAADVIEAHLPRPARVIEIAERRNR